MGSKKQPVIFYIYWDHISWKSIKFRLLINVQTVRWQMNQPQEEEIRLPNCVWGWAGCPTH